MPGNRTKSIRDAATTTYLYDYIDRMTKRNLSSLTWDYWGNMISLWSHAWEYDNSDRLTKFDKNNSTADDFTVAYLPGPLSRQLWFRVWRAEQDEAAPTRQPQACHLAR